MQPLFYQKDYLDNLLKENPLVKKGEFDYLFQFVSEYLYHSYKSGILLIGEKGIGNIKIRETKAIDLFYSFYIAQRAAYPIEIVKIIIEAKYISIISNNTLTETEILELVLMKQLLINTYEIEIDKIINLASAFCSSETRHNVSILLLETKTIN